MAHEVILKKTDDGFVALIPNLGILTKGATAEMAYQQASDAADKVTSAYKSINLESLLRSSEEHIHVSVWSRSRRNALIAVIVAILLGFAFLGISVGRSVQRAAASLKQLVTESDPAMMEKKREKFKALLENHRPLIEEWQKATEKK